MRVIMKFHGPFRVSTGEARPGVHSTVDPHDLLPASSLRGVMRDSAERLLPGLPGLIETVFGGKHQPCVWAWESARFNEKPVVTRRARVALDQDTGTAKHSHLQLGEEVWARQAEFSVTRHAILPDSPGPEMTEEDHLAVLACAAAGVHHLGANRRRGLGWVTCAPVDPDLDNAIIDRFQAVARRWRETPSA